MHAGRGQGEAIALITWGLTHLSGAEVGTSNGIVLEPLAVLERGQSVLSSMMLLPRDIRHSWAHCLWTSTFHPFQSDHASMSELTFRHLQLKSCITESCVYCLKPIGCHSFKGHSGCWGKTVSQSDVSLQGLTPHRNISLGILNPMSVQDELSVSVCSHLDPQPPFLLK